MKTIWKISTITACVGWLPMMIALIYFRDKDSAIGIGLLAFGVMSCALGCMGALINHPVWKSLDALEEERQKERGAREAFKKAERMLSNYVIDLKKKEEDKSE